MKACGVQYLHVGLMLTSKPSTDRVYVDLRLAGREPYPSSDPTWDVMLTHREEKKKQPNYSFLCVHNKCGYPGLWLMHLICSSFWSSVAFGIQKDVSAAATFVWLTGQRREAVPRQLSGAGKLCTPCAIFHQVIMKTGTVASPALWNVDVHQRKHAIDQTCDGGVFANGFNLWSKTPIIFYQFPAT